MVKILSGGFIFPRVKIMVYFLQRNQSAVETEEGGEPKFELKLTAESNIYLTNISVLGSLPVN